MTGSSGTPVQQRQWRLPRDPRRLSRRRPEHRLRHLRRGQRRLDWTAIGGTSGAAPLWAAVLAVAASADANTAGYGTLNPILYQLAQKSPGSYLNDVTTGNNDYNAANGAKFTASSGYDMATGLGTPVTSALATGLTTIPLDVAVSGSQVFGGSPTFTATRRLRGLPGRPLRRHR